MGETTISSTYGAMLIGASIAFVFTGIVTIQCLVYFKLYPDDRLHVKSLVGVVWTLDTLHSIFLCVSLVHYFITWYGVKAHVDHITWGVVSSVLLTAGQTLIVHCFFAQKIFRSSKHNWFITAPILLCAFLRVLAATVSAVEMIRLKRFSAFNLKYPGWIFTSGLSLSASTDILITGSLCYYLREMRSRVDSTAMIQLVDTLTLYTIETGALTCLATIASLICWLAMPKNLIFLGLHVVIAKLYANSLLASLNTRKSLRRIRRKHQGPWLGGGAPVFTASDFPRQHSTFTVSNSGTDGLDVYMSPTKQMQVNVQKTVEYDIAEQPSLDRPAPSGV